VKSVFRSLVDPTDLINLNHVQRGLFELEVPKKLIEVCALSHETMRNAAVCLGDCVQYYAMTEVPFALDRLFEMFFEQPSEKVALLYFWETFAISNPELFPPDDYFLGRDLETFSLLYLSYLSYDCHHRSALNLGGFRDLEPAALSLLLAIGMQRRMIIDGAELAAQSQEADVRQQLSCGNCFVCGRTSLAKNVMVHHASLFFEIAACWTNPFFPGSCAQSEFFPQSFLAWGADLFSSVNRGRLIHATGTWTTTAPAQIYELSPDESHTQLLEMMDRTSRVLRENDLWQARYDALDRQHEALGAKFGDITARLIESRCAQLVSKSDA
jgi:hypothetical protein